MLPTRSQFLSRLAATTGVTHQYDYALADALGLTDDVKQELPASRDEEITIRIAASILAEREACARECDGEAGEWSDDGDAAIALRRVARLIRARSAPAPVATEQPGITREAYAASLRATARAVHDGIYTPREQPAPAPQPAEEPSDEELARVARAAWATQFPGGVEDWEHATPTARAGMRAVVRAVRARLRPVVVTDEMVERAVKAFWADKGTIRAALEAALGIES